MKLLLSLIALGCSLGVTLAQSDSTQSPPANTSEVPYEIRTIFGKENKDNGGFGAFMMQITDYNEQEGLLVGGRGGWILNHFMSFGFGGYGLTTPAEVISENYEDPLQLEYGYGGLYVEPIVGSKWPIHLTFPVLIGAGGAALTEDPAGIAVSQGSVGQSPGRVVVSDAFFIFEPGVNVEFNFTKFLRLSVGTTYTMIEGLAMEEFGNSLLEGMSGNFTLKLGKF